MRLFLDHSHCFSMQEPSKYASSIFCAKCSIHNVTPKVDASRKSSVSLSNTGITSVSKISIKLDKKGPKSASHSSSAKRSRKSIVDSDESDTETSSKLPKKKLNTTSAWKSPSTIAHESDTESQIEYFGGKLTAEEADTTIGTPSDHDKKLFEDARSMARVFNFNG